MQERLGRLAVRDAHGRNVKIEKHACGVIFFFDGSAKATPGFFLFFFCAGWASVPGGRPGARSYPRHSWCTRTGSVLRTVPLRYTKLVGTTLIKYWNAMCVSGNFFFLVIVVGLSGHAPGTGLHQKRKKETGANRRTWVGPLVCVVERVDNVGGVVAKRQTMDRVRHVEALAVITSHKDTHSTHMRRKRSQTQLEMALPCPLKKNIKTSQN